MLEARAASEFPLHESGTAPRITVTDVERLEVIGGGLYCFVCTHPITINGQMHRDVVVYLDATPWAIAKGIILSVANVPELCSLLNKVKGFFTFH
jgi:hypothetical protein